MEELSGNISLSYIDINEFKEKIYSSYLEIFPKNEQKSFKTIEASFENGYTKIIKILNDDIVIGFMILNKINETGYSILDYFAIFPQYRRNGFGSKALKILLEQEAYTSGIFIEIEKVGYGRNKKENIARKRRQQFYERLGFKSLDFDLNLFNTLYSPYVFSNIDINEAKIIKEIFNIYETVSGKSKYLINKNCKIIRPKIK